MQKISENPALSLHVEIQLNALLKPHVSASLPEAPGLYLTVSPELPKAWKEEAAAWLKAYSQQQWLPPPSFMHYDCFPNFTKSVFAFLAGIPLGSYFTYGQIAEKLDLPKGGRAVGNACGANPYLIFVPCHRVLRAGRGLGGFTSGLEIKKRLLAFEEICYI